MGKLATKTTLKKATKATKIEGPTTILVVGKLRNRHGDPDVSGEAAAPSPEDSAAVAAADFAAAKATKAAEAEAEAKAAAKKAKKAGAGTALATLEPPEVPEKPLTATEHREAVRLHDQARKGLGGYLEAARALTELFDSRLYRHFAPTWAEYLESHVGMSDRRFRQLREEAVVVRMLPAEFAGRLNSYAAATLGKLPEKERVALLEEVRGDDPAKPIRAEAIRQAAVVRGLVQPVSTPKAPKPPTPPKVEAPTPPKVEAELADEAQAEAALVEALGGTRLDFSAFAEWLAVDLFRHEPDRVRGAIVAFRGAQVRV